MPSSRRSPNPYLFLHYVKRPQKRYVWVSKTGETDMWANCLAVSEIISSLIECNPFPTQYVNSPGSLVRCCAVDASTYGSAPFVILMKFSEGKNFPTKTFLNESAGGNAKCAATFFKLYPNTHVGVCFGQVWSLQHAGTEKRRVLCNSMPQFQGLGAPFSSLCSAVCLL